MDTVLAASQRFAILPAYIEKDYWITRMLKRMSQNPKADKVVFKGGTSLAKACHLTNRFSEDIDIAVVDVCSYSGNQLKMLIKRIAKDMAADLEEIVAIGVTSKGSRFYKAVYAYPNKVAQTTKTAIKSGQLALEINTYANPYPYDAREITSFVGDFLGQTGNHALAEQYDLQKFEVNVLDKRQTMVEKLASLIRFSFSENLLVGLAAKIRHFYDLYYLANDAECSAYLRSAEFKNAIRELLVHDQQAFNVPKGWQSKKIVDSPLVTDFSGLWEKLRSTYQNELGALAFAKIPDEHKVADSFRSIISAVSYP
jgi:predicted nucleotidyltransferase component of viral defense system